MTEETYLINKWTEGPDGPGPLRWIPTTILEYTKNCKIKPVSNYRSRISQPVLFNIGVGFSNGYSDILCSCSAWRFLPGELPTVLHRQKRIPFLGVFYKIGVLSVIAGFAEEMWSELYSTLTLSETANLRPEFVIDVPILDDGTLLAADEILV